jgi:hypothetical protein
MIAEASSRTTKPCSSSPSNSMPPNSVLYWSERRSGEKRAMKRSLLPDLIFCTAPVVVGKSEEWVSPLTTIAPEPAGAMRLA